MAKKAIVGKQLTERETEVLIHIANGLSNKEIADLLSIGVRTIETHRERVIRKLDIHSIAGLTRYALREGLITLDDVRSSRETASCVS